MKALQTALIAAGVVLLAVGGCSMLDVQEVGKTETTYYDQDGKKTHTVAQDVMLGDKPTEYYKAAGKIADASERVEAARINGILEATRPQAGENEAVVAWKGAAATLAITNVSGNSEEAIKALYYGKDRYDNTETGLTVGGQATTVIGLAREGRKVLERAFDSAGDRTQVEVAGDRNNTKVEKQEIRNDIHANTTGDNSAPSVTADSTGKCPGGDCGGDPANDGAELDANGNPCTGDTPILYNGTCYSQDSVDERGFPIGE